MSIVSNALRQSAGHHDAHCQWRQVVGYEGLYEVSVDGRVRSVDRVMLCSNGKRRKCPSVELRQRVAVGGYLVVQLSNSGCERTALVHRLVAEAFIPRYGVVVRHIDGDPARNVVSNLAWGTQQQNIDDKTTHGTVACGEGHGRAVMTEVDVVRVRAMHAAGKSQLAISRETGFGRGVIGAAVRRETWKHVL